MSCETHDKCDSRCHMARSKACECVCGGANHGIAYLGTVRAAERLREWNEQEVEDDAD